MYYCCPSCSIPDCAVLCQQNWIIVSYSQVPSDCTTVLCGQQCPLVLWYLSIDWLIVSCFTPHRQYSCHVTVGFPSKSTLPIQCAWFLVYTNPPKRVNVKFCIGRVLELVPNPLKYVLIQSPFSSSICSSAYLNRKHFFFVYSSPMQTIYQNRNEKSLCKGFLFLPINQFLKYSIISNNVIDILTFELMQI